jgi:hypothetical protein
MLLGGIRMSRVSEVPRRPQTGKAIIRGTRDGRSAGSASARAPDQGSPRLGPIAAPGGGKRADEIGEDAKLEQILSEHRTKAVASPSAAEMRAK